MIAMMSAKLATPGLLTRKVNDITNNITSNGSNYNVGVVI